MSLYARLAQRAEQGKPLIVGVIGAGKFGAMYLAQVPKTPGVHVVGIADLVIGHHPHVPQGVGFRQGRPVFYSLGNFVFAGHGDVHDGDVVPVNVSADGDSLVLG